MELQTKIQLLKEEYFHLQKVVEDFDSKSITIKAWSVTGSFVAISTGLKEEKAIFLILIGAIASLIFWIIEGHWKAFQYNYYFRIEEIERFFRNPEIAAGIIPLQITETWERKWESAERKSLFVMMTMTNVFLPHAIILIAGIFLYAIKSYK